MILPLPNKLLCLLTLILCSTSVFSQPAAPAGKMWQKQANLSDDFNGDFNTGKWQKPLWNYGVPVNMIAANSGVSDGNLWIKATLGSGDRWFNTSRVMSNAQIKYPYYTEASIKTAHISAYTTFWLNNGDSDNRDEIDIIENNSKPSCNCQPNFPWQMNSQYFHVVNGDTRRAYGNFNNRNLSNGNPLKGVKWNEAYHVVGVWQKDARNIQFYLNGEPAGSVVSERDFTRNMNVIWDLWTGDFDWLGGLAIKSDLNNNNINTMYVDWINTWKLVDDTSGGSTSSSSSTSSASSSGGDQCNTTGQCRATYGNTANDCKNSSSDSSVCMCGAVRCDAASSSTSSSSTTSSSGGTVDECNNLTQCTTTFGAGATVCQNPNQPNSNCLCGSTFCRDDASSSTSSTTTSSSGGGDQCNTTGQCRATYGSGATDCKNSRSNASVCMCGNERCDS